MQIPVSRIDITKILFLDIETVPQHASLQELSDEERELWQAKSARLQTEGVTPEELYKKAGIFAEFGRIVCISVAFVLQKNNDFQVRLRSFAGHDEKQLLFDFMALITKYFNTSKTYFCAHNGIEFDFPYIARRALINGIQLPKSLDTRGKKPWDSPFIDTVDLWRFGDYKNYTSLKLLTHIFGIPSPKDDIDGSMVCDVYWRENNLQRIVNYCQKDVLAILQLFRKYRCEALIENNAITIIEPPF